MGKLFRLDDTKTSLTLIVVLNYMIQYQKEALSFFSLLPVISMA